MAFTPEDRQRLEEILGEELSNLDEGILDKLKAKFSGVSGGVSDALGGLVQTYKAGAEKSAKAQRLKSLVAGYHKAVKQMEAAKNDYVKDMAEMGLVDESWLKRVDRLEAAHEQLVKVVDDMLGSSMARLGKSPEDIGAAKLGGKEPEVEPAGDTPPQTSKDVARAAARRPPSGGRRRIRPRATSRE